MLKQLMVSLMSHHSECMPMINKEVLRYNLIQLGDQKVIAILISYLR